MQGIIRDKSQSTGYRAKGNDVLTGINSLYFAPFLIIICIKDECFNISQSYMFLLL